MSTVDRNKLREDGVRRAVREAGLGHLLVSDDELEASRRRTFADHPVDAPVWIFAYGSLMWSPLMQFAERRRARVHGWHRGFYLWSMINRGTAADPGLVLALDRGGACDGIACRLDHATAAEDIELLWRREMIAGTYSARWMRAHTADGPVRAVAFVVNRDKPTYAGRLDDDAIIDVARRAHGHYGPCRDYLVETAQSLEKMGMADARLSRLAARLREGTAPL
jgi:cation transport protein ChaC